MNNSDFFKQLISESKVYDSLQKVEAILNSDDSLDRKNNKDTDNNIVQYLPTLPIYKLISNLDYQLIAGKLQLFSKEQRQSFLDIDLWEKDRMDPDKFAKWIEIYFLCQDDQVLESFVTSESFLSYLKGVFNIWTFDPEEPEYPDHDYYFLSEDQQLLFEYSSDYPYPNEIIKLLKHLYFYLGPEQAYKLLFAYVSESFSVLEENQYSNKKSRLQDIGLVDYFEALELISPYPRLELMNAKLAKIFQQKDMSAQVATYQKIQGLSSQHLIDFDQDMGKLQKHLERVSSSKRADFLKFNFIRLIHSTFVTQDALNSSQLINKMINQQTISYCQLGFDYLVHNFNEDSINSIFDKFDFTQVFKIGKTLISIKRSELKKALGKFSLTESSQDYDQSKDSFMGRWLQNALDYLFKLDNKICDDYYQTKQEKVVNNVKCYELFSRQTDLILELLPIINQVHENFQELQNDGAVQSDFYMNYTVEEIDFEAIVLSMFIQNTLGQQGQDNSSDQSVRKLGLSIGELNKFIELKNKLSSQAMSQKISDFSKTLGINCADFTSYLLNLLKEYLEDYNFCDLKSSEYKFIGGAILFHEAK